MPTPEKTADPLDDPDTDGVSITVPELADGADMWRLARDSRTLDLNTSYAYLLFARDFGRTSRIARIGGEPAGFVLGYRRPARPEALFVWQIAVAETFRGRQLSSRLLDDLVRGELEPSDGQPPIEVLETTITEDNAASRGLFDSFARRWGADLTREPLFTADVFPDGHEPEPLHVIAPITAAAAPAAGPHDH